MEFSDWVGVCKWEWQTSYGQRELTPNNTNPCEVYAENVHLLYSPPEPPLSRDMCATTPLLTVSDFGNAKHVPQTVLNGTTLYRDRVYLSVDWIFARTTHWSYYGTNNYPDWVCDRSPLGSTVYNTILELRSHEVSSIRVPYSDSPFPFNYADLAEPVPRSAWLGRSIQGRTSPYYFPVFESIPGTYESGSHWRYPDVDGTLPAYEPFLAMPSAVTKIDPEWAGCEGYAIGWRDPPLALQPTASIAPPKVPAMVSAEHGQPTSPRASETIAQPASFPSQMATATVLGYMPAKPTASTPTQLGNNEQQNEKAIPKAFIELRHKNDRTIPDPSAVDTVSPSSRISPYSLPSATRAQGARPYAISSLNPGRPSFTLKGGEIISAVSNGLVVDALGHGMTTIPYSALATEAWQSGSRIIPQLDQLYSSIREALDTLEHGPGTSPVASRPLPTTVETPGKIRKAKHKIEGSASARGNFHFLPECFGILVMFDIFAIR